MKKYEFTGTNELSEESFNIYSNSDITFYKKGETFYVGMNEVEKPWELGTLDDVEELLRSFGEE